MNINDNSSYNYYNNEYDQSRDDNSNNKYENQNKNENTNANKNASASQTKNTRKNSNNQNNNFESEIEKFITISSEKAAPSPSEKKIKDSPIIYFGVFLVSKIKFNFTFSPVIMKVKYIFCFILLFLPCFICMIHLLLHSIYFNFQSIFRCLRFLFSLLSY